MTCHSWRRGAAVLMFTMLAARPAAAVILDFEALAHADADASTVGILEEDGFRLTSNIDPVFADQAFGVWGSASENFNGSTAVFNAYPGFVTTLRTISGDPFTANRIDVGPLAPDLEGQITFVGRRVDDSEVTATFSFGPSLSPPSSIMFGSGFSTLASLSWEQDGVLAHQFDNIDVVAAAPVPEPRTYLLVAVGLGLLLWGASRHRRHARTRIGSGRLRR